jgi:hypothetical protein
VFDRGKIIDRFRQELRCLQWDNETLEQTPHVTRRFSADGVSCEVVAHALEPDSTAHVIREEASLARTRGMSLEWKVFSFDSPRNLPDRLRAEGFSVGQKEGVVFYDLTNDIGVQHGDVRPVTRENQLKDYETASEAAFGRPAGRVLGELEEAIRLGDGVRGYVAYEGDVPCSVGRLYLNSASAFSGLYGGGTVPAYRGRGHYRAVVAARARDARDAGARYLTSDALPTSLPILLRLGFVHIADTWPCTLP